MLALLAAFGGCTLEHGENPYKILGISKTATDAEIKSAYRKITMKHHPDISKTKESERIWIKATDAFELLKDPDRRRRYDQTGSVGDPLEGPSYEEASYEDFDLFGQFFRGARTEMTFHTDEVTTDNFDSVLEQHRELILYVYKSSHWMSFMTSGNQFEQVAQELGDVTKFVRHDVARQLGLVHRFGIHSVPTFMYFRKDGAGNVERYSSNSLQSREDIIAWIEGCWAPRIKYIKSERQLEKWLRSNSEAVRVVSVERGNEASKHFMRASSLYQHAKFAVVIDDYVKVIRKHKLTDIPCTMVFRGEKKVFLQNIDQLKKMTNLVMKRLRRRYLADVCAEACLLHCGQPSQEIIANLSSFDEVSTVWIAANSNFAKNLGMREGQWALISGKRRQYSLIDITQKYSAVSKFLHSKAGSKHFICDVDQSLFDWVDATYRYLSQSWKNFRITLHEYTPPADLLVPGFILLALLVLPRLNMCF